MLDILALLFTLGCVQALEVPDYSAYTFEHYLSEFPKEYSVAERLQRRSNFVSTLREITLQNERHVRGESGWIAGVNRFSDWSSKEFQSLMTLPKIQTSSASTMFSLKAGQSNPDSIDWREKGAVTPIKTQGCGDCWAFAATETLESHYQIATGELVNLSAQAMVNCVNSSSNPNQCGGKGGCLGANFELAYNYTTLSGLPLLSDLPYLGHDDQCKAYKATVKTSGYVDLPPNDAAALETTLATKGPVAVAVRADTWMTYRGGVYDTCAYGLLRPWLGLTVNHGVQVVGYTKAYWIVRNSWGTGFGDAGYIYLTRAHDNMTWTDKHPGDGSWCKGTKTVTVGGECGILAGPTIPTGVTRAHAEVVV